MTDPPAVPGPDAEAEWYRRRRAERESLPLPDGLVLLDDSEAGFEVRLPTGLGSHLHGNIPALKGGLVLLAAGLLVLLFGVALGELRIRLGLALAAGVLVVALLALVSFGALLRRFVAVRAEGVEVGWWPVPLLPRRLVSREIRGLFVRRRDTTAVQWWLLDPDRSEVCELWIVRPGGRQELLVDDLTSAEHARFLEVWLERRLGIGEARAAAGAGGGAEGS